MTETAASVDVLAAQVREAAEAVEKIAPSPWRYDGRDIFCTRNGAEPHHLLVPLPETWHESQRVPEEVARYIALIDPATVLALVARVTEDDDRIVELETELVRRDDGNWLDSQLADTRAALADAINALRAIHDYHCGCSSPGSPHVCVCKPLAEFEVLARLDGSSDE